MFSHSTQRAHWMFPSQEALQACRMATWTATIAKYKAQKRVVPFNVDDSLSCEEETTLVRHLVSELRASRTKFEPALPVQVLATASALLARFFLHNSAMDFYPPYRILNVALFVALKAEEVNIPLHSLIRSLGFARIDEEVTFVRQFELSFLKSIKFHLTVYSAFRPLRGLLADWMASCTEDTELVPELRSQALELLLDWLPSDAMFLFPPSKIALAALALVAERSQCDIQPYLEVLCKTKTDGDASTTLGDLQESLRLIQRTVSETLALPSPENAKALMEKLSRCRNPFNNTQSEEYKRLKAEKQGKAEGKKRAAEDDTDERVVEKKAKPEDDEF